MAYKSLLACTTGHDRYLPILSAAARLAEINEAHLSVLCLGVDRTNPGVYYAGAEAIALQSNFEQAQVEALAAERQASDLLRPWTVPWETQTITTQIGALSQTVGERTVFSDLVILPKPYGSSADNEDVVIAEAALFNARVPVLILPEGQGDWTPPRKVVVAWNQSQEALAAIRGAMGFLRDADDVDIVIIDPPRHTPDRSDPGGALAEMLSRHDVHANITVLARTMPRVSEVLSRHCVDREADLLVMGAYGHSRLREAILGGATRNMLEVAEIPVLMAH